MKRRFAAIALLSISALSAQEDTRSSIVPPMPQQWEQIQQYLVLSPAQVSTLEDIRKRRLQDEQAVYRQVAEKQRQMYGLLQQGSNDAATIGRLMVEINNLNRQMPLNRAPYRVEVMAVLTTEQKTKLNTLSEALKLQGAAWQAIELNMVDHPNVPDTRILPMPMPAAAGAEPGVPGDALVNAR